MDDVELEEWTQKWISDFPKRKLLLHLLWFMASEDRLKILKLICNHCGRLLKPDERCNCWDQK